MSFYFTLSVHERKAHFRRQNWLGDSQHIQLLPTMGPSCDALLLPLIYTYNKNIYRKCVSAHPSTTRQPFHILSVAVEKINICVKIMSTYIYSPAARHKVPMNHFALHTLHFGHNAARLSLSTHILSFPSSLLPLLGTKHMQHNGLQRGK